MSVTHLSLVVINAQKYSYLCNKSLYLCNKFDDLWLDIIVVLKV